MLASLVGDSEYNLLILFVLGQDDALYCIIAPMMLLQTCKGEVFLLTGSALGMHS